MNSSITIIPVFPTYMITNIFDFAMANLFCFAIMFNPEEIFDYFTRNRMTDFDCLFGRCGDRLLIVCY